MKGGKYQRPNSQKKKSDSLLHVIFGGEFCRE